MGLCIQEQVPFYYSGRRHVVRAQVRNPRKIRYLGEEFKRLGLKTEITWYYD